MPSVSALPLLRNQSDSCRCQPELRGTKGHSDCFRIRASQNNHWPPSCLAKCPLRIRPTVRNLPNHFAWIGQATMPRSTNEHLITCITATCNEASMKQAFLRVLQRIIVISGVVAAISGCRLAPKWNIVAQVNTIAPLVDADYKTFTILSGVPGTSESDIEFREYAAVVSRGLCKAGFMPCLQPEPPDLQIILSYGVSGPQQQVRGYGDRYGGVVSTENIFCRHLELRAFDSAQGGASSVDAEVWRTKVVSEGSNSDLRGVFPYLVTAAAPHFGQDTRTGVIESVRLDDERVAGVRAPSVR